MPSQTNLLHVLEGNSPGCRASPATRLQNGLTRHQGAAGVYASAPRHFPPSTGGAKIHGDFRGSEGWVRSSAWHEVFSSTLNTAARAG